jgi:hypothetical protein
LRSFAFSAPFGIGPITEYALTGKIGIDPAGYIAWGTLGAAAEFAILGSTKFAVYAPVVGSAFFGELGLFTVTGLATPIAASAGIIGVAAVSAVASKTIVDTTYAHGGSSHLTSYTGQMSGKYFDY